MPTASWSRRRTTRPRTADSSTTRDGGPADTDVTRWVQDRANELLRSDNREVRRVPYEKAIKAATTHAHDFIMPYVHDLAAVIDLDMIRSAGIRIGVDPSAAPR